MSDDKKIIFGMHKVSKVIPSGKQIIKNINLSFFYGAKIGIIGLNGSGKSTLLKIIAGIDKDFKGEVFSDNEFSVGLLEQEPQLDDTKTVMEIVREGVQDIVDVLDEFNAINDKFADPNIMDDPDAFQNPLGFDGITGANIAKSAGYSITVGKRDSSGNITNTTDFYHFTVDTNTATSGGVSGGGNSCSAGPATLTA